MSCYNPMAAAPDYDSGVSDTGKYRYKIIGKYHPDLVKLDPNTIKIPCGKCIGCKFDYARTWADRMVLEYVSQNKKGCFVTLTYDDDHVNCCFDDETGEFIGYDLSKRDAQLFIKRLRKHFGFTIRYYLVGEYGKRFTLRPHLHAILFGVTLNDFAPLKRVGWNELGQSYYSSDVLANIWKNGFVGISELSYKTCAYVARYTTKKIYGHYVDERLTPEFALMSRNKGIGFEYYDSHKNELLEKEKVYINDGASSVEIYIPKYFRDKLSVDFPDVYANMIEDRKKMAIDKEFLKLRQSDLSYSDLLEIEEKDKFNKTKILFKRREGEI